MTPATPDPLSGLRDWHLPEPVAWWPPAPGWWLAALLLVLVGAVAALWWRDRRRAGAADRLALERLAWLRKSLAEDGDRRRFVAGVSQLLRRLALIRYPRERVAGLAGRAWLELLDATGGQDGFTQGPGRVLGEAVFRPDLGADGTLDPDGLYRLAETWIRANPGGRR